MENNKYGVIYYKETANLGDDIQTYAASRLLPMVDYYIDREKLSYFVPDEKEKIKVVINGWYNHDKTQVIPSPYIEPYYISVHFSENDLILKPGYTYLKGYAKDKMNQYKIGCRDKYTLAQLKKIGYKDSYFSSCITTTLDPIGKKKEEDYIVVVDMKPEIIEHLKNITDLKIIETTHWLFLNDKMSYEEKLNKIDEFDKGNQSKRNKMIEKHIKMSIKDRMKLVEKQLQLYQNAKLVITDRIHVGLPCLGLKTNTLLIYYDYNRDRIETFKELLTNCTEEDFMKMTKEELKKIKNKNDYKEYRKEIIKGINNFVKQKVSKERLPEIEVYKDFIKREEYLKKLYNEKLEELKQKNQKLEEENNNYKEELEFFMKVKYSKSWKIIGKMYEKKSNNKNHK